MKKEQGIVTYLNSGDWVENLTALEYKYQKWSIYEYDETEFEYVSPRLKVKSDKTVPDEIPEVSTRAIYEQIMNI